MQIHVALVLLLLLLSCYYLFCVLVCFFWFGLFSNGKKILTLGSEMEKTWMIILCFQYKHIYLNWS